MIDDLPEAASGPVRGFAWPKDTWLYHATTGAQRLLDEGFKTREQLGGAHALGGGPDNGISFALDRRVTRSIAIGLDTLRRAAKWELGLGDLILQAREIAPKGLDGVLQTIGVTPEEIARLDQGLTKVSLYGRARGYFGAEHLKQTEWDQLRVKYVEEHYSDPRATKPYLVEGWAPIGAVVDVKPDAWARGKQHNEDFAEVYKLLLAHAEGAKELYNPVFWATNMEALAQKSEDDVGIVRCRVNADWICADWRSAEDAGLEPETQLRGGMTADDWSNSCDSYLGRTAKARSQKEEPPGWHSTPYTVTGTKWEAPDPSDTIAYRGGRGGLTEVRVYDPSIITDLSSYESMEEIRDDIASRFFNKGVDGIDDAYAHPYFRSDTPRLR